MMKKLIYVVMALVMVVTTFSSVVYAEDIIFQNAKFQEAYSKIDWDGKYDDNTILVGISASVGDLSINDFPLLDLASIEEIFSTSESKIYEFTLIGAGRDKIKEAIDHLAAYSMIDYAEPNYFFELCVWEPDDTLNNPWKDLDYETEIVPYLGDIDLDQRVTVLDAIMYVEYVTGHCTLSEIQLIYADVNEDGEYNILDAIWIAQKIVA